MFSVLTLFIEKNSKNKRYIIQQYKRSFLQSSNVHKKSYITFLIHPPLMMAQSWAESTCTYGRFINQFPPNIIRSIRQFERINKKICRQKMSILFNQIVINEEMLQKYTHTHTHIYVCVCVCLCVCVCVCVCKYICTHTHTHTYIYT